MKVLVNKNKQESVSKPFPKLMVFERDSVVYFLNNNEGIPLTKTETSDFKIGKIYPFHLNVLNWKGANNSGYSDFDGEVTLSND